MKYFILALVVFIAISAIIAENDTVTENNQEEENENENRNHEKRSQSKHYDPTVMAPKLNPSAGLLFRRKIRSEEGGCCCC